jgi:hypothetical protein
MLCCYLNVFVFVYINECIDVNTALKNSFKPMNCSGRIYLFPRNFLRWQAQVVSSYILSNLWSSQRRCSKKPQRVYQTSKTNVVKASCIEVIAQKWIILMKTKSLEQLNIFELIKCFLKQNFGL